MEFESNSIRIPEVKEKLQTIVEEKKMILINLKKQAGSIHLNQYYNIIRKNNDNDENETYDTKILNNNTKITNSESPYTLLGGSCLEDEITQSNLNCNNNNNSNNNTSSNINLSKDIDNEENKYLIHKVGFVTFLLHKIYLIIHNTELRRKIKEKLSIKHVFFMMMIIIIVCILFMFIL